ncbi:DUF2778 domain-containing protein [Caballeronia pedi]|uniref:DUF2778 domain-containing protein n=1 Tax=Caballeronia pedi TaxID=1777141 RepID=UPI000B3513BF|nr:DUF2778 domain-containing protein [Caballeronia pedi]
MPVRCTFTLNNKTSSTLICSGYGTVEAFSGQKEGINNPNATDKPNIGPIPPGTYYLVDRQSGGLFGDVHDWMAAHTRSSDRSKWFMLWNPDTGDDTMIHGIRRGQFRLHPSGDAGLSEGCITLVNPAEFEYLQRYIRKSPPQLPVPKSIFMAYGTVEVR